MPWRCEYHQDGSSVASPLVTDDDDGVKDVDRELDELIGELRVILPAATVLFAFLLSLPFSASFEQLGTATEAAFAVAFSTCGAAIILLAGESAYHRLRGKPHDKRRMLITASRQATAAISLLSVTLAAVVFFVFDVVYGFTSAVIAAAVAFALAAGVWVVLPLARRFQR